MLWPGQRGYMSAVGTCINFFGLPCFAIGWDSKWCVPEGKYFITLVYCFCGNLPTILYIPLTSEPGQTRCVVDCNWRPTSGISLSLCSLITLLGVTSVPSTASLMVGLVLGFSRETSLSGCMARWNPCAKWQFVFSTIASLYLVSQLAWDSNDCPCKMDKDWKQLLH